MTHVQARRILTLRPVMVPLTAGAWDENNSIRASVVSVHATACV